MSVCAVVGGQFGSEGKGLIVGHIAKQYDHHVRVGAANAGHTLYTQTGVDDDYAMGARPKFHEKHIMQQLPCAAYANPKAALYIGPGALISHDILNNELDKLAAWRDALRLPWPKIFIDRRAHVITDEQIVAESRSGLAERIGSTSTIAREGIGQAQADRVMRDEDCVTAQQFYGDISYYPILADVPDALAHPEVTDGDTLLEGTQGAGLSLTTGPFPYVTSRNTTAAGLCADCGIAPTRLNRVILVVRTFPIRVAGNSGPFHGESREITWGEIGIDPEKERTTVTKKIRRVATFSMEQVIEAARINGATEIALTFADYVDPLMYGSREGRWRWTPGPVAKLIEAIEARTGIPVSMIGTGPYSVINR
jgi:adenylosuccinate synthase